MKKFIYLTLLSFLIISCNNTNKQTENANKHDLTFTSVDYNEQVTSANKAETKVVATVPVAEGDSLAAKRINDKIFNTIRSIVGQEGDASNDYNQLFTQFIKNYETFVLDNKDYEMGWEAEVKGTVEYETPNIINIKIVSYTMTGGAHGNPYTTSLVFNPKDGKELVLSDIIKDKDTVTRLAEKKFREKFDIPAGKSFNDAGYMLDEDKFILPQNVFITKDGLLLFYNVYEIAPYADGTKELLLPTDEIKDYLLINIQ